MEKSKQEITSLCPDILVNLPFGLLAIDGEGKINFCNEQALLYLNIEKNTEEMINTPWFDHLESLPSLKSTLENSLAFPFKSFDLTGVSFKEKYLNFRGRQINSGGMIVSIEEITQARKQELANLNALFERQEMQRRKLAQEIHDGIGPVLSTIKLHLDALESELTEIPEKSMKKISAMHKLIHEVADDIRSISHALMPGVLMDLGLVVALDNLCKKANESERVLVNFYHSGIKKRLGKKTALGIYRIVQELLNNAFKHSKASTINVQLIKHPDTLLLMVEDDGIGFDKKELKNLVDHGIGLRNIHARSRALGGQFNIDTRHNQGMLATVEIPLKN